MDTLTRLEKTIAQRRQADPSQSYVASLHAKGPRAELGDVFLDALSAHVEQRRAAEVRTADLVYLI